jgi:hypothetical protein
MPDDVRCYWIDEIGVGPRWIDPRRVSGGVLRPGNRHRETDLVARVAAATAGDAVARFGGSIRRPVEFRPG